MIVRRFEFWYNESSLKVAFDYGMKKVAGIIGKYLGAVLVVAAGACGLYAAEVADLSRDGVVIKVDAEPERVDVARDFFVTVTFRFPAGADATVPDLRDRFGGFSIAEDFVDEPHANADGSVSVASRWRLVPEPCARRYRLAPFVVAGFHTAPVVFEAPAPCEAAPGNMEIDPRKDLPPLTMKFAFLVALAVASLAAVAALVRLAVRRVALLVRVRRMDPRQRALFELERLLKRGLPGRGFYKDFYVELTMVVRRYVQRRHGIRAPHLTTEEFLAEIAAGRASIGGIDTKALAAFLESADLVKFAGVEATPAAADAAAEAARGYIEAPVAEGGGK